MKLVLLSDTHALHRRVDVPDGDVLVHAGDITRAGELETIYDFSLWLASLPHTHKIVIAGNHDFSLDISHSKYDDRARKFIERRPNIHYLEDSSITIDGLKFFGSPWVPNLARWAFYDRNCDKFERAPRDVDVLVTHGPPWNNRDGIWEVSKGGIVLSKTGNMHVGSKHLMRYVAECVRLKLHVFGHVHEGYGASPIGVTPIIVNASTCTRMYEPSNVPIVVELAS